MLVFLFIVTLSAESYNLRRMKRKPYMVPVMFAADLQTMRVVSVSSGEKGSTMNVIYDEEDWVISSGTKENKNPLGWDEW